MKPFVCLLFAVVLVACGTSTVSGNIVMMPEAAVRAQLKAGASDFNLIMNLMLMGMSDDMIDRVRSELESKFGPGAQAGPGAGPQYGSDDPVLLRKKRRRRSAFDDPFFQDFNKNLPGFDQPTGYDYPPPNEVPATDGNYISYPGADHPSSSFSSNYFSSYHRSGYGWGRRLICPRQVDQGGIYEYASDPNSYPAVEIGQELFVRSLPGSDLLFQSLSRSVVFPTDPPQIIQDEFLATSNATCRTSEDQLWSYQSRVFTGRCYPLVNFQETPFFTTCLNRFCKNCQSSSSYYYGRNRANICVTEYTQVSLWVYCEELLPNVRIVKDRILVPTACTCTTVQCQDAWRRGRGSHGW